MTSVTVYTDGSSRGNPGPGGYGALIEFVDSMGQLHVKELSQGYEKTTNNRMELMAAIAALEALNRPCEVSLWSDSQYLINAFNQHWIDKWIRKNWMLSKSEPVKNADLWQRLLRACETHHITWNWVRGHNGHAQNERCDALATQAADSDNLIPDPCILSGK
jgi:ribonuclease HI